MPTVDNDSIFQCIVDRRANKIFTSEDLKCIEDYAKVLRLDYIIDAFNSNNNDTIKQALCKYIDWLEADLEKDLSDFKIRDYINTSKWVLIGGVLYDWWE